MTTPNAALLRAGYISSCKDAEFIGNKDSKSHLY